MRLLAASLLTTLGLAACAATNRSGQVTTAFEGQWVTLGGGLVAGVAVVYLVDPGTQTCYVRLGLDVEGLDCCALRRLDPARPLMPWLTDATCTAVTVTPWTPAAPGATP